MTNWPAEYAKILEQNHGDKNCCAVITLSLTCDLSFKEAQAKLKKQGRQIGRRTYRGQLFRAIEDSGYTFRSCPKLAKQYRTVRSLEKARMGQRTMLVATSGHVLAFRGGRVLDYTSGRLHRIQEIFIVEKA